MKLGILWIDKKLISWTSLSYELEVFFHVGFGWFSFFVEKDIGITLDSLESST